jgi:hypothetical protein
MKETRDTLFEVDFSDYDYILFINGQIRAFSRSEFSLS